MQRLQRARKQRVNCQLTENKLKRRREMRMLSRPQLASCCKLQIFCSSGCNCGLPAVTRNSSKTLPSLAKRQLAWACLGHTKRYRPEPASVSFSSWNKFKAEEMP